MIVSARSGHGSAPERPDLPLLYVAARRGPGDAVSVFNDVIEGGSISMTGVRIGYDFCFRTWSTAQAPGPAKARYRKTQQYSAASSP